MDLRVRDLTVEYVSGGYVVRPIDGLDLEASSGELVLLLGASGCGKTTLLSVLAAILSPASGSVRLGDLEVTELSGPALARYRRSTVGIVFQAFNLIQSLSAQENVEVPLRIDGVRGPRARARAATLLQEVAMTDRARHRPGDLSGGQQQRVAVARALAHDPPLLLADEPTAHLDYIQVEGVLRLLRKVTDSGRIVVVATHDERMVPLADKIVQLTPAAPGVQVPPERLELAAGQVLFRQGEQGDRVYVVESGTIHIVRERADGAEELLDSIGPGGYFGELAPMFGLRRAASARAGEPSVLTGYSLHDFRERLNGRPLSALLADSSG